MHTTAMAFGQLFFETYLAERTEGLVVEVGAQDVNGSLRSVCPEHFSYVGVDFVEGRGVDLILEDPYRLPFDDASVDVVVCSSVFEHSEFFWLLFLEVVRILKPDGLFYLNAPSNGVFHRYPVDCWRFYPDSGKALVRWAARVGYPLVLLESFIGQQSADDIWNDFVAVFLKAGEAGERFPRRMLDARPDVTNGCRDGEGEILNFHAYPQDIERWQSLVSPAITRGKMQLFYDVGAGFNEAHSLVRNVGGDELQSFTFDLSGVGAFHHLRLDPLDDFVVLGVVALELELADRIIDLLPWATGNAAAVEAGVWHFATRDPQWLFNEANFAAWGGATSLRVTLRFDAVGRSALDTCLGVTLTRFNASIERMREELFADFSTRLDALQTEMKGILAMAAAGDAPEAG